MSGPTREVELKARVDDIESARRSIETAGALLVFEGSLRDRVYDTPARTLSAQDLVLRLRCYGSEGGTVAHLDWKGPTSRENGFKIRAELTTEVSDPDALARMLVRLGYEIVGSIDRDIVQYELSNDRNQTVVLRFEIYPRMDTLVEIEGTPTRIEDAIRALGIPRASFSADRLADFVRAFESRTGRRAAICESQLDRE